MQLVGGMAKEDGWGGCSGRRCTKADGLVPYPAEQELVPLLRREVMLPGPRAEAPLSDYRNVPRHAVDLNHSKNTCRTNRQC